MAELKANPSGNDTNQAAAAIKERGKEEAGGGVLIGRHHKETHGTSDDIDDNTPPEEVKAPGVLHRMKEEVEAVVEAILPKKDSSQ